MRLLKRKVFGSDRGITAIWSPVVWLRAFEAKVLVHKRFELCSCSSNLALLRHGRVQTLQISVVSIKILDLVRFRFNVVDTQTRRRRRVPNAPPRRACAPSAGTICYSQRPTSGMSHSPDLRPLRKTSFQSGYLVEMEGGTFRSFVSERQHPFVGDIPVISVSRKIMLADIFASPRPAASFIPFRDSLLGRTSRITPLDSRDASTPDDDVSLDE